MLLQYHTSIFSPEGSSAGTGVLQGETTPQLDSCRRCAAFSVTDFVADAADWNLVAADPEYWWRAVEQAEAGSSSPGFEYGSAGAPGVSECKKNSSGSNIGVQTGQTNRRTGSADDPRQRACRRVESFLGPIPGNAELELYRQRVVYYIRSPPYRVSSEVA